MIILENATAWVSDTYDYSRKTLQLGRAKAPARGIAIDSI